MNDTALALRVLRVIQGHDKRDPVTGHALAEMFGVHLRIIQNVVEQLRDAGHKVGSSMSKKPGYFLAESPEELQETAEHYRSRAREFFGRANRLLDFGGLQPTIFEQEISA